MVAQPVAQRLMQEMGGRVIGAQTPPPVVVNQQFDRRAGAHFALVDAAGMDEQIADLALGISDREGEPLRAGNPSRVTDLAARFPVKWRLVDDQRAFLAGGQSIDLGAGLSATTSPSALSVS